MLRVTSRWNLNNLLTLSKITPAQFAEAEKLWNLAGVGNPARGDDLAAVEKTLRHGGRLILLYADEQPVGTVWLTHDHRRLYIHHMAVHPEHQGRGLGKLLIQAALRYAARLKLQAKLEVHAGNAPANRLYASFGFDALDGYRLMIKRKY